MKMKLSPARELDFEGPGEPQIDPKSTEIAAQRRSRLARAVFSRLGGSKRSVGATVEATWVDLGSLGGPVGGVRSVWSARGTRTPYG